LDGEFRISHFVFGVIAFSSASALQLEAVFALYR
jgi:hypothetical protein